MTLGPEFKHADRIAKARRVRTPAGARFFGLPIGSLITGNAINNARSKYGMNRVFSQMEAEGGFAPAPITGARPVRDVVESPEQKAEREFKEARLLRRRMLAEEAIRSEAELDDEAQRLFANERRKRKARR